jgi:replicative DNA helicase
MPRRKAESAEEMALRVLPHALEAERALLGALLVNPAQIDRVAPLIQDRHFFRRAHQAIYASMLTLAHEKKVAIDCVTLRDELTKRGEMDEVGGPAYVPSLMDGVPRTANVAYYAAIV